MTIIAINSKTSGKYTRQKIAGRDHIVTNMRPIRGDITMNDIFYSNDEVKKSYTQLDNMIAPSSHPVVNGVGVSAYHPIAINANNVGGYVKNPRMKGKEVIVDFLLDLEVANQSDNGKELIRRIENSEQVAVSTGLTIAVLANETGKDDFGKPYSKAGHGFKFDHVAVLLNEQAAGAHAGTELVLNNDKYAEPVQQATLESCLLSNDLTMSALFDLVRTELKKVEPTAGYVYIAEIFPGTNRVVYEIGEEYYQRTYTLSENDAVQINDDRVLVVKKVEFEEVETVNKELLIAALIANSLGFVEADKDMLTALNEQELAALIAKKREGDAEYLANKTEFLAYKEATAVEATALREKIIANSEFTAEMLANKPIAELKALAALSEGKPKTAVRLPGTTATATNSAKNQVSYS